MIRGRVVIDTDLAIDYLRGSADGTVVRELLGRGVALFTVVTQSELLTGSRTDVAREAVTALCRSRVLSLTPRSAAVAGSVGALLRAHGRGVGMPDTLIAGICLRHGLPLATRNVRHFSRVPDLQLYQAV